MKNFREELIIFISSIKRSNALYALLYLLFPTRKRGRQSLDQIKHGGHLGNGFSWKNEPKDDTELFEFISQPIYFPWLKGLKKEKSSTKNPSKCIEFLALRVCEGKKWIESFITSYWPYDPKNDFKEKLKKKTSKRNIIKHQIKSMTVYE